MTEQSRAPKNTSLPYANRIGERIRALRESQNLSLSELSRHASIAKGTLSALEAGRGNPTVMTLVALGRVLGLTPSDFLKSEAAEGEVTPLPTGLSGPHVMMRFLTRIEGDTVWEVYDATIPKSPAPYSSDTHDGIEHVLVLEGQAWVGPSDDMKLLSKGAHTAFDGSKPHSYHAPSGETKILLIMEYAK